MSLEDYLTNPKGIFKLPEEQERLKTVKEKLLAVLLDGKWHTNTELKQISHRFSARLLELRQEGWMIEREYWGNGIWAYRLRK
ncbi:MAG: hypothetical protein QXP84_07635 [Candidatus Korarchaeum sp.]